MKPIIISFIVGLICGFFANYFYDLYKKLKQGNKPYVKTNVTGKMVEVNGQIPNTETCTKYISKLNNLVKGVSTT